jgi:hypothetical protein
MRSGAATSTGSPSRGLGKLRPDVAPSFDLNFRQRDRPLRLQLKIIFAERFADGAVRLTSNDQPPRLDGRSDYAAVPEGLGAAILRPIFPNNRELNVVADSVPRQIVGRILAMGARPVIDENPFEISVDIHAVELHLRALLV